MAAEKNKNKYFRVIDANLNRAREGLRVIEDTARFVRGGKNDFKEIREARHLLDKVTRGIYPKLLKQRDPSADEGRTIKEEKSRKGIKALLSANFRRVEESLRVLEEYGKLIAPGSAAVFKRLRFKAYILEREFLAEH